MNLKNSSYYLGHRERLREKFLAHKCMDYEVLELLLSYAIPRIDVKPIVKRLTAKFGNVHKILSASMEELVSVSGIGKTTAIFVMAIYEIVLLDYKNYLKNAPVFHDYKKITEYCRLLLSEKKVEEFHVLYLDSDFRLLSDDMHSSGTIDWAAVYPREILKRALDVNAGSVIMLHNHPISKASFSTADIEITADVKKLLKSVDVELFDHLLVSGNIIYSAKNMFLLD